MQYLGKSKHRRGLDLRKQIEKLRAAEKLNPFQMDTGYKNHLPVCRIKQEFATRCRFSHSGLRNILANARKFLSKTREERECIPTLYLLSFLFTESRKRGEAPLNQWYQGLRKVWICTDRRLARICTD